MERMEERKCLQCGLILEGNYKKKFCSKRCLATFAASKSYHKNKDNPEYKAKRKKYFNAWRVKNREHFNSLLREPNRIRYHKLREERLNKGLCLKCGKERTDDLYAHCFDCRILLRGWNKVWKNKKKEEKEEKEEKKETATEIPVTTLE